MIKLQKIKNHKNKVEIKTLVLYFIFRCLLCALMKNVMKLKLGLITSKNWQWQEL